LEAGDRFGDYRILKRLASGGMAEVYLARKSGIKGFTKPLAVKVILPSLAANKDFIEMFLNEARLAVSLNHAHIAQILNLGEWQGQYFIAMEFAHGADLQQISSRTRKAGRLLPLPYAAKIVSQIAEGLYYAHTKTDRVGTPLEIVHRDVSPHNIILTFDGIAKLIDFGVAKARITFQEESERGILKGKFSYMSPEQVRGMPVDPRSDIFALGIVLWEICTGANLFRESSELLTMEAILRKPVPKPRELRGDMPPELEAVILRALAKRSVDRYQTAAEMHQALETYLNQSGWSVGTQHLSEFLKRLFPETFSDIRDLLDKERSIAESEQAEEEEEFVPWEPYEEDSKVQPKPAMSQPDKGRTFGTSPGTAPFGGIARGGKTNWLLALIVVALAMVAGFAVYMLVELSGADDTKEMTQPATGTGTLEVTSKPAGAQVFINGESRGRTPAHVAGLPLGEELTLRVEKRGFESYLTPVRLTEAGKSVTINVKLTRP
jgi:serine/threonine protein kinase